MASSGAVYFATDEYAEIPAGSTTVDVRPPARNRKRRKRADAGELSTIVDPVPYVASVTNTTTTEGGAEIESDADLAERVYLAPGAYSTAGPEDAICTTPKRTTPP